MNKKNTLVRFFLLLILFFSMQYCLMAQDENQQKESPIAGSTALNDLSHELSGSLKLSQSQENRINDILKDFQNELDGTSKVNQEKKSSGETPAVESTNKARQDKTEVRDPNNAGSDVNTGSARTKNETNDMTGRNDHAAVSFERARIDADSRIEELLTPEQAIQYGKIKSDWWDKVREKIQPHNLTK